jgi:hypothetical protein
MPRSDLHWVWPAALVCFLLAGAAGSLWRFGVLYGLPAGLEFANLRHAHSHLMYFGWVTPALMALIATWLPTTTGRTAGRGFAWTIGLVCIFALSTFPLFLLYGYAPVSLGSGRLPLALIASSLNILAWYAFAGYYLAHTWKVQRNLTLLFWDAAMGFLLLASLGAWGRALLAVLQVSDPFWGDPFWGLAMVHLFLDSFSEGWFVLGLLGCLTALRGVSRSRLMSRGLWLMVAGLPVIFLLSLPEHLVPAAARWTAGLGGALVGMGTLMCVGALWKGAPDGWRSIERLFLAFLALRSAAMIVYSLPLAAVWLNMQGLRIPYLHILSLGFVTLALVYAAGRTWQVRARGEWWMVAAVITLLVSLAPFTGLWPSAWTGAWMLGMAAWISLLPLLVGAWMLARNFTNRLAAGEVDSQVRREACTS